MNPANLNITLEQYAEKKCIAVVVKTNDRSIWGRLSVNEPLVDLAPDEFLAKVYSKNASWAEVLLRSDDFEFTGKVYIKHFPAHSVEFPIYRVTPNLIHRLFEQTYNSRTDIYDAPHFLFKLHEQYCDNPL